MLKNHSQKFQLFIVSVLLFSFQAATQKSTGSTNLSVKPLVKKTVLPRKEMYIPSPTIQGRLLYSYDTAVYGPGGFAWPWQNYFVVKQYRLNGSSRASPVHEAELQYKVDSNSPGFILQPKFSPDGQMVALKFGDRTSSFSSFSLQIYDLQKHLLIPIDAPFGAIGYLPVVWSPNSLYMAYFRGGFREAFEDDKPLELWVYDLRHHKSILVTRHEGLTSNAAWTPDGALLYTILANSKYHSAKETKTCLSQIFKLKLNANSKPMLVMTNVLRPTPSFDGNWVAAFSDSNPRLVKSKSVPTVDSSTSATSSICVVIYSKQKLTPLLVSPAGDIRDTALLWSSDSQHLYRITRHHKTPTELGVDFFDYSIALHSEKLIASTLYQDEGRRDEDDDDPLLNPTQVSKDGHSLFFSLIQKTHETQNGRVIYVESLQRLDLTSGSISTICQIDESGIDWHDETLPAPKVHKKISTFCLKALDTFW